MSDFIVEKLTKSVGDKTVFKEISCYHQIEVLGSDNQSYNHSLQKKENDLRHSLNDPTKHLRELFSLSH